MVVDSEEFCFAISLKLFRGKDDLYVVTYNILAGKLTQKSTV